MSDRNPPQDDDTLLTPRDGPSVPADDDLTLLRPPDDAPAAPAADGDVTVLRPVGDALPSAGADDDRTVLRPADAGPAASGEDGGTVASPSDQASYAGDRTIRLPDHVPAASGEEDRTVLRPAEPPIGAGSVLRADGPTSGAPSAEGMGVKPEAGDTESPLEGGAPAAAQTGASGGGFAGKLKRLGSESLIYGLSSIVGRFLSYLLQPYYANRFNPGENGIQSVVYTFAPILGIAFLLGMDVAYMRQAAQVKDAPLQERQRAFTMTFGIVGFAGAAALLAGLLLAVPLAHFFRLPVEALRFMLAIVYTDSLIAVPYAHLRMTGHAKRYAILRLLFVLISVGLNVVLIAGLHWGVTGIFVANLVGNLVVFALFLPEVAKWFRPALLRGAQWKPLWHYALPIMPATLAVMVVENGDRMVLNWLPESTARAVYGMASKDVVGIYNFDYKLGVAMLLVVQMFRMAWTPFSLQHGRDPQAPRLFARVMTSVMLICAAAFLGLAVLIPSLAAVPVVHRLPSEPSYWLGLPIVPVILLGYVFSGMYAIVTAGLYIEKKTKILPWIAGAGAAINIAVCIVAARHSMVAVAWATPASYALMAALGAWQSNKVYPVPFEWTRLAHLGAIVAAIFFADQWLAHHGWRATALPTLG